MTNWIVTGFQPWIMNFDWNHLKQPSTEAVSMVRKSLDYDIDHTDILAT